MLTLAPIELHRFLLGLDSPREFRDWLYANLDLAEQRINRADFFALLELDFDRPHRVVDLVRALRRRVLPLPPAGEEEEMIEEHLVHADALQAAGDPRGELIALQASLLSSGQQVLSEAELLSRHEAELLGPIAPFVHRGALQLEWFMGYIASASIGPSSAEDAGAVARALLSHPSGSRLRALQALAGDRRSLAAITEALASSSSRITTLILDSGDEYLHFDLGDLGALFRMQVGLRVAELNGIAPALGPLPPEIVSFTLRTYDLDADAARSLARSHAPMLERLELWFGESDAAPADLAPLLSRDRLPRLRHLSFPAVRHGHDELVQILIASDLLPGLRTLDLSRGRMTVEGARTILAEPRPFLHLDRFDLRWNGLDDALAEEIARALPRAHVRGQWMDEWEIRRLDLRGEPWW